MKKAGFIVVALGIIVFSSGCTVVHSHSCGRSHRRVTITAPMYDIHRPVRHRHIEVPWAEPPRHHRGHSW